MPLMQSSPAGTPKKKKSLMIGLMVGQPKDSEQAGGPPGTEDKPPEPVGSPEPAHQPPTAATPPGPEAGGSAMGQGQGESTMGKPIPPEAVGFHTAAENCGACEYMLPDSNCSWLKIPVQHGDHCQLFQMKGGEPDMDDMAAGGPPPSAEAMGHQPSA